jgi:hypothetical protein
LITVTIDADVRVTPCGWLTLAEAAAALGVSIHSVRRRARAGQLVARQVPTDRGPAWRVLLHPDGQGDHVDAEGDATVAATVAADPASSGAQGGARVDGQGGVRVNGEGGTLALAELVALLADREARIDELTGQLVATTEAATLWQQRASTLTDRLAAAESRMAALEAPKSSLGASAAVQSAEPTSETFSARLRPLLLWVLAVLAIVTVVALQAWR